MLETKTRTIDGVTFYVDQLRFKTARQVLLRLSKRVAPGLGAVLEAMASGSGEVMDADTGKIGEALENLLAPLSDEDLDYFAQAFGEVTRFSSDGDKKPYLTPDNQEVLFRGRVLLYFRWLAFCVEANYSDFFALLKGRGDPE